MSESIIKAENLCFSYDEDGKSIPVLKNINLSVERGSFVAVLGHNGSGKSTLAKLLSTVLTPTDGRVFLFGRDMSDKNMTPDEYYSIKSRVGMVFQNPDNQLVATVVEEDVAFGPENLGVPSAEIRKRVDDALATVNMKGFEKHSPHQLSGGQKQRVAIAGILALMPEVIILDEATAMLDPIGRSDIISTVKKLNKERGITILHITHYMEEASQADRIIVLDNGELIADGTPKEVFSRDVMLKNAGLDVPQVTEISKMLNKAGYGIPNDIIDVKECADEIEKLIRAGKGL